MGEEEGDPGCSSDRTRDVLLELMEVCGFSILKAEDDDTQPRIKMLQALRKLSSLLDDPRIRDNRVDSVSSTFLVQIEHILRRTRETYLPMAMSSIENDVSQVLFLKQEIEEDSFESSRLDQVTNHWSWVLLGLSMVSSLTQQLNKERVSIHGLTETLDFVFADDEVSRDRAFLSLTSTIQILERKVILENPEYLDAANLLVEVWHPQPALAPAQATPLLHTVNVRPKESIQGSTDVFTESTVDQIVQRFMQVPVHELPVVSALLVVGPEGSGKTYLCDQAERIVADDCTVVRPKLPLDCLGQSVGETEDLIVAMFGACISDSGKAVLILDDAEHLLGSLRWKRTFLDVLDSLHVGFSRECAVLVMCTSKDGESSIPTWRFDRIFYLDLPREDVRREMLMEVLDLRCRLSEGQHSLRDLFDCVVEASAGRTYAEMKQLCRQALLVGSDMDSTSSHDFPLVILSHVKERLSSLTPASLRDGVVDSFVDMRILSSIDLTSSVKDSDFSTDGSFPFRGSLATNAWKELLASIVIPLCRSRELDELLDCSGSGPRRALAGGVLLTGPSCSGKSSLALHCAKYAATMLPSVKLLDVSCTSLIHKELGGSERAVHHLFDAARKASPCILIMDGIENVAAVRGNDTTTEGTLDRVLSTLLVELDGVDDFTDSEHCSMAIIGITSNERWIDPAVKRPGRLEKTVHLEIDWE